MKRLIACCGLDCEHCDARRATVDNDDAPSGAHRPEMERNERCTADHGRDHPLYGCRTEGVKFAYCSDLCRIRKCVSEKGLSTCGDCREVDACPIVGAIFRHAPDARENLRAPATS